MRGQREVREERWRRSKIEPLSLGRAPDPAIPGSKLFDHQKRESALKLVKQLPDKTLAA